MSRYEFLLREGEQILREDRVLLERTSLSDMWFIAGPPGARRQTVMCITNQRVAFLKPKVPLLAVLFLQFVTSEFDIELADIVRFHTWHPEFAGPPVLVTAGASWSFDLGGQYFARSNASRDTPEVREHFRVLEGAWRDARARAAAAETG